MTVAYSAFVALLWCSSCLALLAGLAAVVLSAVWAADNDPALLVSVGGVAGALLLAWAILPYLHDVRVLIRSGSFPALCMGDEFDLAAVINEGDDDPYAMSEEEGYGTHSSSQSYGRHASPEETEVRARTLPAPRPHSASTAAHSLPRVLNSSYLLIARTVRR